MNIVTLVFNWVEFALLHLGRRLRIEGARVVWFLKFALVVNFAVFPISLILGGMGFTRAASWIAAIASFLGALSLAMLWVNVAVVLKAGTAVIDGFRGGIKGLTEKAPVPTVDIPPILTDEITTHWLKVMGSVLATITALNAGNSLVPVWTNPKLFIVTLTFSIFVGFAAGYWGINHWWKRFFQRLTLVTGVVVIIVNIFLFFIPAILESKIKGMQRREELQAVVNKHVDDMTEFQKKQLDAKLNDYDKLAQKPNRTAAESAQMNQLYDDVQALAQADYPNVEEPWSYQDVPDWFTSKRVFWLVVILIFFPFRWSKSEEDEIDEGSDHHD